MDKLQSKANRERVTLALSVFTQMLCVHKVRLWTHKELYLLISKFAYTE